MYDEYQTDASLDNLMLFRRQGPMSPTVFNYNPWTFLWSVERYFPLPDCTDSPGTDYVSLS